MSENVDRLYRKWYDSHKKALGFLKAHSRAVANFAVPIAKELGLDAHFVYEGALLHDIGIVKTNAPSIGCTGVDPYICHGIHGAEMVIEAGMEQYASVCTNHVGVAITKEEIQSQGLPLPAVDMIPQSDEEILIAYTDKLFSKRPEYLTTPKPIDVVLSELSKFGERPVSIFKEWHEKFTGEQI